jgi:hypothetical protein
VGCTEGRRAKKAKARSVRKVGLVLRALGFRLIPLLLGPTYALPLRPCPYSHPLAAWRQLAAGSGSLLALGVMFTFFNARTSSWSLGLFVYLLPKSTIRSAQHDLEGIL